MTTSRIYAYRWPARLVSHKPFAAERYFITSPSIWQVFFAENYDFSFLFSLFCQWPYFLCKMHNPGAFCRWKTPPLPFAASVWAGKAGVIPNYIGGLPQSTPAGRAASSPSQSPTVTALPKGEPLAWREGFRLNCKASGRARSPSGELSRSD